MGLTYTVIIEKFAERHFIKSFSKKYKLHWEVTLNAIIAELERIDTLLTTDKAEIIAEKENIKIVKTRFRVAGTREFVKSSGNRCIVCWDQESKIVAVLLVYSKTDLSGHNETQEWKKIIKNEYSKYKSLI